jgi:hypothetical protein
MAIVQGGSLGVGAYCSPHWEKQVDAHQEALALGWLTLSNLAHWTYLSKKERVPCFLEQAKGYSAQWPAKGDGSPAAELGRGWELVVLAVQRFLDDFDLGPVGREVSVKELDRLRLVGKGRYAALTRRGARP